MDKPWFFSAVFWIIRDKEWRILFQKRANTWYRDGSYQLPSWHVEAYEGMEKAIKRELLEEINVNITSFDLVHITQWINPNWREYFNIYFEVHKFDWDIQNLEKDKCSELYWATEEEIESNVLFEKDKEILKHIKNWIKFSETAPWDNEFNSK